MKNGGDIQFLMVKIMADSNDNHPLAHVHSFQWSICVFHISSVSTTEKYKAQEMVKRIFQRVKPYLSSSTVRQKYIGNTSSLWSIPSSLLFSLCATSDWEVWFNQERILQSFRLHKACTCYLSCECLLYQELWLPVLQRAQTPVLAQRDTQYSLTARPHRFCSAWGVPYSVSTDAKPKRNRGELVIEGSRIWL